MKSHVRLIAKVREGRGLSFDVSMGAASGVKHMLVLMVPNVEEEAVSWSRDLLCGVQPFA